MTRHLARVSLREESILRVLMNDIMLSTKMPHPTPRAKHEIKPINFKTVISFADFLTHF